MAADGEAMVRGADPAARASTMTKPTASLLNDPSFLALTPFDSIEAAERQGQRVLGASTALPTAGLFGENRMAWEAMGLKYGEQSDGLFTDVELPAGWCVKPSAHAYWSDLLDEKGRKRAMIFYKAASYDRRATIRPVRRFTVEADYDAFDRGMLRWQVTDMGTVVFSSDEIARPTDQGSAALYNGTGAPLERQCEVWLADNGFSDYLNPAAYWE
jgi:hypothetical protein